MWLIRVKIKNRMKRKKVENLIIKLVRRGLSLFRIGVNENGVPRVQLDAIIRGRMARVGMRVLLAVWNCRHLHFSRRGVKSELLLVPLLDRPLSWSFCFAPLFRLALAANMKIK